MLARVTFTMASFGSFKTGLSFSSKTNFPCSLYVYASMSILLNKNKPYLLLL